MERNALLRLLLVLLIVIAAIYLIGVLWQLATAFADIILLFFLAWLLAFILGPIARFLTLYYRLPRLVSIALVYLGLALALAAISFIIMPILTAQLIELGRVIPDYVQRTPELLANLQDLLNERGIPADLTSPAFVQGLAQRAEGIGTALAQNALVIAQSVATVILNTIIILILSFYIMLDGQRISAGMIMLVPEERRHDFAFLLITTERAFGGFLRGSLIVGIIYGIGNAIVMWLADLGFILPVSVFAGLMMFIPVVGGLLAIIPPILIAALTGSVVKTVIVFLVLFLLQQIALNVISPRVIGRTVGIHPLLVLLAIFVGFKIAGFWGALFGVPVMGVVVSMATFFYLKLVAKEPVVNNNRVRS